MKWQDRAIILGAKSFGETNVILEVFSEEHGLHKGLVRGGASKAKKALLQPGNLVSLSWSSRLNEQLGFFTLEVEKYYSVTLIQNSLMLSGFDILRFHLRLLAEREKNIQLYKLLVNFLECGINFLNLIEVFVKFEFAYIHIMGIAPDLSCCVVTNTTENLCYVSPKSLQAVCYEIGKDWHNQLLPLPEFLLKNIKAVTIEDILGSYKLVTYILERYLWENKAINPLQARKIFFMNIIKTINGNLS